MSRFASFVIVVMLAVSATGVVRIALAATGANAQRSIPATVSNPRSKLRTRSTP